MKIRIPALASLLLATAAAALPVSPERRELLKQTVDELVGRGPLARARTSVAVMDAETGEMLYAHNADAQLNPASDTKLVTAAAVLARLGPEYKFATDFACSERLSGAGHCPTLFVKGRGDPSLTSEKAWGIVGELFHMGLRSVGDVVVDDSYFDGQAAGPGYDQQKGDNAYLALTGALSINYNIVGIYVTPPAEAGARPTLAVEPPSDYFVLENRTESSEGRRGGLAVSTSWHGDTMKIVASGRLAPGSGMQTHERRVGNPSRFAGETIRQLLRQRGINATGEVRRGVTGDSAELLYSHLSEPLAVVIRALNKHSNNFVAEQLMKTLGAEVKGTPGSWEKGVQAAQEVLEQLGIGRDEYVLRNGSGLNDTNRIPAGVLTRLVSAAARSPYGPEFLSSLPIAGRDGTLHARMEGTPGEGRVRAKTGTLTGVSALSGLATLEGGLERWSFAVIVNNIAGARPPVVAAMDRIAIAVASGGRPPPPPDAAFSREELLQRGTTYVAHGRTRDAKGRGKLREALRRERDPSLRAVAADVLGRQLSAEDAGELAVSFAPGTVEGMTQLAELSRELGIGLPLVTPLAGAASAGRPEAMDRLLLAALAVRGDAGQEQTLSEALEQAGRSAATPVVEALLRADATAAESALILVARAIARTTDAARHPLVEALQTESRGGRSPQADLLANRLAEALREAEAGGTSAGR